ncbi:MAG: glycosyltransferase family 4 protein [Candidatus Omnitrophica bacterium]|nr:glycosyltransferase family 4 protein [Candidatus Omnitrophota bacterium]
MKVLFVPYGTERAPATRYRVLQYIPHLESRGINCRVFSAISQFSTALMIKSSDFSSFLKLLYYIYVTIERILRFLCIMAYAVKSDIVFLQRSTFPFKLEALLSVANRNIVFDIDDAIYMPDRQEGGFLTSVKKFIKENEVVNVLKVSKAVIVENEYIRNYVCRYCKNIYKIPGPIDTERFFVSPKPGHGDIIIGWIGSPATTPYLYLIDNALAAIGRKYNFVRFKFVGVGKYKNPGIKLERVNWTYGTEVVDLQSFDIGIMPMPDNEWTRGKLGCKMLQYMAVGIPAVVSYTPTNAELISEGKDGFFVKTDEEWTQTLSKLVESASLRERVGQEGRVAVEKKCALNTSVDTLISVFNKVRKQ